jgi:hypothetical protein
MDEVELRRLAEAARTLLWFLIPDEAERARVDKRIADALALTEGHAETELLAALSSHPALYDWKRGRADWLRTLDYSWRPPARHLSVEVPERAPPGYRLSLLARITLSRPAGWHSALLKPFDVPPEGATVTITVSAPGLEPAGDLEHDLHVPAAGDSDPVRFGFTTRRTGLHTVAVRAFRGGTFLAELSAQISVESVARVEEGRPRTVDLESMAAEQGEVTLEVGRTDGDLYSFRLWGEAVYPVELSKRLAGDPTRVVEMMVDELCRLASGTSPYATPEARGRRLRNLGVNLWADAVPEAVRRQFWEQRDRIGSFTVASDTDVVPWELLYPADGHNDNGFLVEQFPVVRRVHGQGRARTLALRNAAYVVPRGSPKNALDEIDLVRGTVGKGVADLGVVERLGELDRLLEDPPSLLHFACHNKFSNQAGSIISMDQGPFSPTDLAMAVQKRSLRHRAPLVFLNACRTAGAIPGLTRTMGWAKQFMAAGAGAFLGSLWAVRSSAAQQFAGAFYESFVTDGLPLGQATLQARRRIASDDGDPTWLAYTIYGNPAATVAVREATRPGRPGG